MTDASPCGPPAPWCVETGRHVVHPWLCDAMGHLATQHYLRFYDDALYHFLSMLGPVLDVVDGGRIGWADVRHEIDYRAELQPGDLVVLYSDLIRLGNSSITHRTRMLKLGDGTLCSSLQATTVRFDLEKRAPVPIADTIRQTAMHYYPRT